jgi:hypothetical protein
VTIYEYVTFDLSRGRASWTSFAAHVRDKERAAINAAGGVLVGLFSPQLGFASNEAILLIRWPSRGHGIDHARKPAEVLRSHRELLTPTVRPRDADQLQAGGIYVHRWFTIDGDKTAEFIDLSNRAWGGFEGSYDTHIFGLFTAAPSDEDHRSGAARLLLLTWYRDHGVWEASREQAADAKSLFAQRHLLTRTTIGRSSLLVA